MVFEKWSHMFLNGSEHPLAFASHTLTPNERNYTQLEKETLSLIFGVKKVPLIPLWQQFHPHRRPQTTGDYPNPKIRHTVSISCLFATLGSYTLSIQVRHSLQGGCLDHRNSDGLLQLPLPSTGSASDTETITVFNTGKAQALLVTVQDFQQATWRDATLARSTSMCSKDGQGRYRNNC